MVCAVLDNYLFENGLVNQRDEVMVGFHTKPRKSATETTIVAVCTKERRWNRPNGRWKIPLRNSSWAKVCVPCEYYDQTKNEWNPCVPSTCFTIKTTATLASVRPFSSRLSDTAHLSTNGILSSSWVTLSTYFPPCRTFNKFCVNSQASKPYAILDLNTETL